MMKSTVAMKLSLGQSAYLAQLLKILGHYVLTPPCLDKIWQVPIYLFSFQESSEKAKLYAFVAALRMLNYLVSIASKTK